ncbi:MAG: glyoxalase [Rhizobiaceae bacterium]|nr:glyoxalase [Rhizobiaceae bacterium]
MQIGRLDHVNVRTSQLDNMIDWYTNILGMKKGVRPNFSFPGAWMYSGEDAVVHLVQVDGDPGSGSEIPLKLEHFALAASGREVFEARLRDAGEKFEILEISDFGITQYNVWDPDGNHIHIDFT